MLNPSTADATQDDATIRRCVSFSHRWGHGGLVVVNLYAYRAIDPGDLWRVDNPVGPENNDYIRHWARRCATVVAAWGCFDGPGRRAIDVRSLLLRLGCKIYCLGTTRGGDPRHPVRLAATTPLEVYRG
jgi:hypothetical protein